MLFKLVFLVYGRIVNIMMHFMRFVVLASSAFAVAHVYVCQVNEVAFAIDAADRMPGAANRSIPVVVTVATALVANETIAIKYPSGVIPAAAFAAAHHPRIGSTSGATSVGLAVTTSARSTASAMTGRLPRRLPYTAIANSRAIDGSLARFHMEFCFSFLRSVILCHGRMAPTLNAIFSISIVSLIFVVRNFARRLRRSRLQQNRASVQRLTACAVFALCMLTLPLRIEGFPAVRTPEAFDALMQHFVFMFFYNCVPLRWLGLWFVLFDAVGILWFAVGRVQWFVVRFG